MTSVSIVIPVFNQLPYTRDCLAALRADPVVAAEAEVIVVDSGSTDGTDLLLRDEASAWADLRSIKLERNLGFSAACNAGAGIAQGEELLFLNNDTIPQGNWLSILRGTLRLQQAGIVGPKLLYPDSRNINHAGYVYNRTRSGFYHIYHHYPESFSGVNRRRDFQALLGACLLIRRSTFEAVHGFSDFGLEDIDLCLKVRATGQRVIFEPRAVVLHHGSVTLRHSPPGTIPPTDVLEFSAHWPKESLLSDDERYYREDGLTIDHIESDVVVLRETMTESANLLEQALAFTRQGERAAAQQRFNDSLNAYLGNQRAYYEYIEALLEWGEVEQALHWAQKMTEHVEGQYEAALLFASLCVRAGAGRRAAWLLDELLLDWAAPNEVQTEASRLRANLT